ncbi:hypothetical protein [Sulfurovum sp. AR]|uniref:hypothetical protein n=1 Tax=Sulfurovum sp. AR TaxID=1165841 RepID=UPI00025C4DA1|nr:hypothetical protein [Sulfurovum sp. AR]EIF50040.1 hypothetical protein SULAR_10214 [Sulfurovum sp. AR]
MKNTYKLGLASIAASLALVGCGGGSSSSNPATVSGKFIDAAVEGLNYTCMSSGVSGVTDNTGTFTCQATDNNVTFSIGAYVIGSSTSTSGIVTPYNITADDTAAVDVAQLLQTLDDDGDGVITIPDGYTALDDVNATPGEIDFESEVEAALTVEAGATVILVDGNTAQDSMDENRILALLGGKTVYLAEENNYVDKWVFDANLTEVTMTYTAGAAADGTSYTTALTLENGWLSLSNSGHIELVEETADYLLFNHTANTVTTPMKFYFDEVTAKAVFGGYIVITEEKLSGKTFYSYEFDAQYNEEIYAKMTFSNGTVTRTEVINGGAPETITVSYEIIDGKIRADVPAMDGDPSEYAWVTLLSETADSWIILDEGDNYQDGTIDWSSETTLYLTKPDTYPDFTVSTTSVDTTTPDPIVTDPLPTPTTEAALRDLLAGKTLYNESTYESWAFNADLTSIYFEDVDATTVDSTNSGTMTLALSGTTLTINGFVVTAVISDKYITISGDGISEKLWYNLADLEAVLLASGLI